MKAIVLVLNGLNVHWLGPYGCEWVRTPNLDRLGAASIVFDQHFAVTPTRTLFQATTYSLRPSADEPPFDLASVLPPDLPIHRLDFRAPVPLEWIEAACDAAEELANAEQGLLLIELDALLPPWRFDPERYADYVSDPLILDEPPADEGEDEGEGEEAALEAIAADAETDDDAEPTGTEDEEADEEPEFVGPDPIDEPTIGPLGNDPIERLRLQASFAAAVEQLDAEVGVFLNALRELELDRDAVWIVTSSFGFPIGEHDEVGIGLKGLHEAAVHVPLFVRLPNAEQKLRRVLHLTQTIDLIPTLAALFGKPQAIGTGHDLSPYLRSLGTPPRPYALHALTLDGEIRVGLRTPEWYLLETPAAPLLFRKPDDIFEVTDLHLAEPLRTELLQAVLTACRAGSEGAWTYPPLLVPEAVEESPSAAPTAEESDSEAEGEE